MKLYLSSYRVPNPKALFELVGKEPKDISVVIIPNSKDYYSDFVKQLKNKQLIDDLKAIGLLDITTLDLNDFTSEHADELSAKLKKFDLIWVNGGNGFCLRYAMRRSGFDKVIQEVVDSGVVYGGESVGAIVAGDSLKGDELADEPSFTPEVIFEGLGLISDYILPHTDSPRFSKVMDEVRIVQKDHPSVIELTDTQAYVVDNESRTVV